MTAKGLIKTLITLIIIGAGVAIGWAVATNTNPYAPGAESATPVAAAAQANNNAVRPTAIPTSAAASGVTGTNTTPGVGTGTPGVNVPVTGTVQGQVQRGIPVTGTVVTYDATSKILTLKDAQGKSQEYDAATARVTKIQKLSSDDFGKSLGTNGLVLLTGEKGSDGTYNAVSLIAVDAAGFGGGAAPGGASGTPGAGAGGTRGAGAAGGTPGARGSGGNFGGGNAAGAGGFGGAGGGVIIRSGTLQGSKFTGTSANGEAITATISDTTLLEKQATGTLDDLKPGANISMTSRAAAATGPATAIAITLT